MNTTSLPFSALVKLKEAENGEDGDHKKKTREEWKKAKELEEARKAGTVPAAVDEEGRDINPHIPQYISAAPWYFGQLGATLKHQRPQPEKQQEFDRLTAYYDRGLKGSKSNKFRKGACENCGAMGHKKRDCVERPRKVLAKYSNSNIINDDVDLPDLALDYDGKRDRWNGYDPSEYDAVVEEHQKVEEYKRQLKAQKLDVGDLESKVDGNHDNDNGNDDDDDDDEEDDEKYADHIDMPGTKVDSKQRITVRNLRIREDTAKYLRNLDISSAYYDPKTRSMRDNPYSNTKINADEVQYAGENFVRFSGDTIEQAKAQTFAWEAYEKGVDISLQAEPTKLEILKKEFSKKKEEFKQNISNDLLEKYGGKEHLEAPPREMLLAQSEHYIEYSRQGKIIKGAEKEIIRSSYEEDIYPNNHLSVWGSFWIEGRWGYDCCHSFIMNSYCTGEAGKSAGTSTLCTLPPSESVMKKEEEEEEESTKTLVEMHAEKLSKKRAASKQKKMSKKLKKKDGSSSDSSSSSSSSSSDSSDSSDEDEDEKRKKRLRQALIEAKLEEDKGRSMLATDDRLRSYNSMAENRTLTEEQIEAYQIRRKRPEDPMANF